jgi:hypothetical protein
MKARITLLALCLLSACATSLPAEPGDENLVLRVSDLAQFGVELPPDYRKYEKLERESGIDGVFLVYKYEFEDVYFVTNTMIHEKPGEACEAFTEVNRIVDGEFARHEKLRLVEHPEVFQEGERRRFAVIENQGVPRGNVFHMCRSRTNLFGQIVGLYFDDPEAWREFVRRVLDELEAYERRTALRE